MKDGIQVHYGKCWIQVFRSMALNVRKSLPQSLKTPPTTVYESDIIDHRSTDLK